MKKEPLKRTDLGTLTTVGAAASYGFDQRRAGRLQRRKGKSSLFFTALVFVAVLVATVAIAIYASQ